MNKVGERIMLLLPQIFPRIPVVDTRRREMSWKAENFLVGNTHTHTRVSCPFLFHRIQRGKTPGKHPWLDFIDRAPIDQATAYSSVNAYITIGWSWPPSPTNCLVLTCSFLLSSLLFLSYSTKCLKLCKLPIAFFITNMPCHIHTDTRYLFCFAYAVLILVSLVWPSW